MCMQMMQGLLLGLGLGGVGIVVDGGVRGLGCGVGVRVVDVQASMMGSMSV